MEPVSSKNRPSGLRRAVLSIAVLSIAVLALAACGSSGSSADPSSAAAPTASSSSGSSQSGPVAFAQCVRAHGVTDFPDPQNGHFIISSAAESNPNFQSAVQACQDLLGPGGIGGGSDSSAMLNYAHCIQTHGVPQFPDPSANGALDIPASVQNDPQFQKAQQDCKSDLPGSQGTAS